MRMAAADSWKCAGRPIAPGVGIGRARIFDRVGLFTLHRKQSDLSVVEALQSLITTLAPSSVAVRGRTRTPSSVDERARILRGRFCEAVERALRREGGGLEFAVATVLTWHQEAIEIAPPGIEPGTLEALRDLAESVLEHLAQDRNRHNPEAEAYIALASSLTLAEAMNLSPGIAGLAVGTGIEPQIATAARLLKVPAILGIPNLCDVARNGDVIRLDGARGIVETLARVAMKGERP